MKKILFITLLASLFLFNACEGTNFDVENQIPEKFHKILYLKEYGKVNISLFDLPDDYTYPMTLVKGGSSLNDTASAKIIVSSQEEVTEKYSNIEGVNYQVIPTDCYTLSNTDIEFTETESSKNFSVAIHPQIVKGYMRTSSEDIKWVLPLVVTSESDSINVNRSELLLMIDEVVTPSVGFVNTASDKGEYQYGRPASISEMVQFRLDFENQWDVSCQFAIDNNYIDSYNSINQTNYKPVPDNLVSITNSMSLPQGTSAQLLPIQISDVSTLPAGDYMVPVRISDVVPFEATSGNDLFVLTFSVTYIIDRSTWTAEANTEETSGEPSPNGFVNCVLDGDPTTYWHSQWSGGNVNPPYEITIDTHDNDTHITSIGLLRRSTYLNVLSGDFYTSSDKVNWTKVGSFEYSWVGKADAADTKYDVVEKFSVTPTTCRYFKIRMENDDINQNYTPVAHMAEIYAYSEPEE